MCRRFMKQLQNCNITSANLLQQNTTCVEATHALSIKTYRQRVINHYLLPTHNHHSQAMSVTHVTPLCITYSLCMQTVCQSLMKNLLTLLTVLVDDMLPFSLASCCHHLSSTHCYPHQLHYHHL